jgi:hypothetical protein
MSVVGQVQYDQNRHDLARMHLSAALAEVAGRHEQLAVPGRHILLPEIIDDTKDFQYTPHVLGK